MSSTDVGRATVLVVDDDRDVVDLYRARLEGRFDVRTAYGGPEALETLDEDVDVVLLDRRMPRMSGDAVLEEIRARNADCRVIVVTAVDPDVDVIDMPFDDYLCKPVATDALVAAIEQQLAVAEYDEHVGDYFAAISSLQVLESTKPVHELEANPEYRACKTRAEELREEAADLLDDIDPIVAFKEIDREPEQ